MGGACFRPSVMLVFSYLLLLLLSVDVVVVLVVAVSSEKAPVAGLVLDVFSCL